VGPELALSLADDDTVGAPERLGRALPATGLAVLDGDFGSGKSVTGERIYLADNAAATADDTAPLPVYLIAKSITDPLLDTVRAAVDRLGDPAQRGIRLVLDGLDESGQARAAELLAEARALVFTWPQTRVVITARPGLPLQREEFTLAYPPLNDEEAVSLAEGLGGQRSLLWGQSEPIRQMLHLPLFLIVAALRQQAGAEVPRSRGTFLRALVDAALDRNRRPTERTQAALESLARLTVDSGGPVAAAELGHNAAWKVLETRLVIREGGLLRFALPVVEQYFAAQPLLEHGLTEFDLEDLTVLDRWRDTLTLAVTIGSWQQVRRLLDSLTTSQPGLAAWVVANAVPQPTKEPSTGLPSDVECARRIHATLSAWVDALAPASRVLGLTDNQGQVRTVGAGTKDGSRQVSAWTTTTSSMPYDSRGLIPALGSLPTARGGICCGRPACLASTRHGRGNGDSTGQPLRSKRSSGPRFSRCRTASHSRMNGAGNSPRRSSAGPAICSMPRLTAVACTAPPRKC
jgi:hypothetical protein